MDLRDNLYTYKALVTRVIDGDTIEVVLRAGFNIDMTLRLRLNNVDTPERGQPLFKESTEFTRDRLEGKEVYVQTFKGDAFGRYLSDVWYEAGNELILFNMELYESGLIKPSSRWNNKM